MHSISFYYYLLKWCSFYLKKNQKTGGPQNSPRRPPSCHCVVHKSRALAVRPSRNTSGLPEGENIPSLSFPPWGNVKYLTRGNTPVSLSGYTPRSGRLRGVGRFATPHVLVLLLQKNARPAGQRSLRSYAPHKLILIFFLHFNNIIHGNRKSHKLRNHNRNPDTVGFKD